MKRRGCHIRQVFYLRQESCRGLNRIVSRSIAAREDRSTKVSHAFEAVADAPHKKFATPDRAVVAVARPIEANAYNALVPFATFREDRGDVCTVVLDTSRFGRSKRRSMRGGCVLRMAIVHDEELVPANFVH